MLEGVAINPEMTAGIPCLAGRGLTKTFRSPCCEELADTGIAKGYRMRLVNYTGITTITC